MSNNIRYTLFILIGILVGSHAYAVRPDSFVMNFTDYCICVSNDLDSVNFSTTRAALSQLKTKEYLKEGLFRYKDMEMYVDTLDFSVVGGKIMESTFSVNPIILDRFLFNSDLKNININPHGLRGPEIDCKFSTFTIPAGQEVTLQLKASYFNEVSIVPKKGQPILTTLQTAGEPIEYCKKDSQHIYYTWEMEKDGSAYVLSIQNPNQQSMDITLISN